MLLALLFAFDLAGRWHASGPDASAVTDVAVAAGSDRRLFAMASQTGSGIALFRTDDGGASWVRLTPATSDVFIGLEADPRIPDRLFMATLHAGFSGFTTRLSRSLDGGESWTVRQVHDVSSSSCEIAFDSADAQTVYTSFAGIATLFRSTNGGETFTGFPSPFSGALLASAADGALVAASGLETWVSRDRGETWTRTAPAPVRCPIRALAVDPVDANRWFVGSSQVLFPCGDVARTDNGGATWVRAADPGGPVNDLATDRAHPGLLYVATGVTEPSVAPGRLLVTSDGGRSWIDLGGPRADGMGAIALPEDGDRVYAATGEGVHVRSLRRPRDLPLR